MKKAITKYTKELRIGVGALLLAALMAVNVQVGMNDGSTTDINLLGLEASVFAPAAVATLDDCEVGGLANKCCPYWTVKYTFEPTGPSVTCTTGGEFKCEDNCDS